MRSSETIEAQIHDILDDHFENAENPHQTIHKIQQLLNSEDPDNRDQISRRVYQ